MKRSTVKLDDAAVSRIAQVIHASMRAWQRANGQAPAPAWARAPKWMKESTIQSVVWRLANPHATTSEQHDQWLIQKKADGWKHGHVKDAKKKTHPMIVPYDSLPDFERRKDALLNAVVDALAKPMK